MVGFVKQQNVTQCIPKELKQVQSYCKKKKKKKKKKKTRTKFEVGSIIGPETGWGRP